MLGVLGVVLFAYAGSLLFAAVAALYLFLTIRFDDVCILDFLRKAAVYFILRPQSYRWGRNTLEVTHHQKKRSVQKREKQAK
ncbi:hypothetical protein [Anaerotruncus colihominis]|uniref:hypothetical protein n=1 Tax=Anaerotruncus colihominis TaxID=169435 RepID=UPI00189C5945|nr:hypothetical protein [Anaerotruncus colihominis]